MPGPQKAVQEYAGRLQQEDIDGACRLLSKQSRPSTARDELMRFLARGGERLASVLSAFAVADLEVILRATVRSPGGEDVHLVNEAGEWKLDQGAIVPPAGLTPESALERFLLAIEAADCEELLECAPPPRRVRHPHQSLLLGCREQLGSLAEIAARIRSTKARPSRISPERAELNYQDARKVVLVKYEDRWYVEDL